MSLATTGIHCTISPPLSGVTEVSVSSGPAAANALSVTEGIVGGRPIHVCPRHNACSATSARCGLVERNIVAHEHRTGDKTAL